MTDNRTVIILLTDGTTLEITEVDFFETLDLGLFFYNILGDAFNQMVIMAEEE